MKSLFTILMTGAIGLLSINMAMASVSSTPMTVESISTSGFISNTDTITDGSLLDEIDYQAMSYNDSAWWIGSKSITMDFGSSFMLQEVLIQVDTEDSYQVDYSIDNINWSTLFTVNPTDGDLTKGMDTMSSDVLHEDYVASMDFLAVETRYLQISAFDGDNLYFISELQAFTGVSPVPAPPSIMLFGAGLMMLMGVQYRRKKQMASKLLSLDKA